MSERISDGAGPRARRDAIRRIKIARALAAERLGSERWSRPALHDMERKLEPYLHDGPGFFVEVGANDGYAQSNTYYLERRRDWQGVLVEGLPHLLRTCRALRRRSHCVQAALVGPEDAGKIVTMRYADLMSIVRGARRSESADDLHIASGVAQLRLDTFEVAVPARTMSEVLDDVALPRIDLMVVDVEGTEADVLRGADLGRHAPRLLLVEANDPVSVAEVVAPWYDEIAWLTPSDVLYRRKPTLVS